MGWIIGIRALAQLDIEEAVNWYNHQKPELGNELLSEVSAGIDNLKNDPFSFGFISPPVRRMVLRRFPYKILFIVRDEEIIILGVVHHKRSNGFLKRRYR